MKTHIGHIALENTELIIQAWVEDDFWNGYAKPWFDKETALSIIDELNIAAGHHVYNAKVDGDELLIEDAVRNPGVWTPVEHFNRFGTEVYGLGNGSWSWVLIEGDFDLFDAIKRRTNPILISVLDKTEEE